MDHSPLHTYIPHAGDFVSVLKAYGHDIAPTLSSAIAKAGGSHVSGIATEGTTVLAIKYKDGVLVAGDRRATAGNLIMYERAEKLISVDSHSVLAIAGSPAVAFEMARVLEHSFKYYKRSQLQEMSTAGKVRALSKLLKENLPLTLQGIGTVIPLFATFDLKNANGTQGKVYFYDALGAQFEGVDYAVSGSGSLPVRSVLHYLNTWGNKPLVKYSESEIITIALRVLDTAAESDNATGGYNRKTGVFPLVRVLTKQGVREIKESDLAKQYKTEV